MYKPNGLVWLGEENVEADAWRVRDDDGNEVHIGGDAEMDDLIEDYLKIRDERRKARGGDQQNPTL